MWKRLCLLAFPSFVYWTVTPPEPEDVTSLYQIDLRNNSTTSRTPILTRDGRKRRRRLIGIDITPALSMNPVSGALILCDRDTGDIIQCQLDALPCEVLVNRTVVQGERSSVGTFLCGILATIS